MSTPSAIDPAPGTLFVVSTPIGNLGDITYRAVETLRRVRLILCEDTRHSRPLLDHFSIGTPVSALHEHNEARELPRLLERLQGGDDLALISDAGTPLLSDPGGRLVRGALDAGIAVVPVPGASALLAALVASGLGGETFTFFGFLPRRGRERERVLEQLSDLPHVGVLYESPHRVADTLDDLARVLGVSAGARRCVVAREITKRFEEFRRGTIAELAGAMREHPARGEIVLLIEGRAPVALDEGVLRESAQALRLSGATTREIARSLVERHGAPRNLAYRVAQDA